MPFEWQNYQYEEPRMADPVKLRLNLVDVHNDNIKQKVDIVLHHQVLNETIKVSASAGSGIDIEGLRGFPQGQYRLEIDPPAYRPINQFVNLKASGTTTARYQCPIDPAKVAKVDFPVYGDLSADLKKLLANSTQVLSFEGKSGHALYDSLDDIRRAGLLNIAVKTAHTRLSNGSTVLPAITEIKEIRGDRFFAVVPLSLRAETKSSAAAGLFVKAGSSLHTPPPGFEPAGSYKTKDQYGNLQLTYSLNGEDCRADIDIDDAAGIEHIFQVLHNAFTGSPTHPYNIHEILVGFQLIDPGYRFEI
jgi:hypothetical protein